MPTNNEIGSLCSSTDQNEYLHQQDQNKVAVLSTYLTPQWWFLARYHLHWCNLCGSSCNMLESITVSMSTYTSYHFNTKKEVKKLRSSDHIISKNYLINVGISNVRVVIALPRNFCSIWASMAPTLAPTLAHTLTPILALPWPLPCPLPWPLSRLRLLSHALPPALPLPWTPPRALALPRALLRT